MAWENILKAKAKVDMPALREAVAEWSKENTHREVTSKEVWKEIKENYGSKLKIDSRYIGARLRSDKPIWMIGGMLLKLGWSVAYRHGNRVYYWPENIPSWKRIKRLGE